MNAPQIAISHIKNIQAEAFDEFLAAVSTENLDIRIEPREEGGPYAGLEWLIPTAVIVYIAKSYFDTFLKEMGRDHYNFLKKGLKTLRAKVLGPSSPKMAVVSSKGKNSRNQPYSLTYSIMAEADRGQRFKLLIPNDVSERDYEEMIDAFLSFLEAYHSHTLDPHMIGKLNDSRIVGHTLLLVFNLDTKSIEPIDPAARARHD